MIKRAKALFMHAQAEQASRLKQMARWYLRYRRYFDSKMRAMVGSLDIGDHFLADFIDKSLDSTGGAYRQRALVAVNRLEWDFQ